MSPTSRPFSFIFTRVQIWLSGQTVMEFVINFFSFFKELLCPCLMKAGLVASIQFNSKNFNYPTRGNFVVNTHKDRPIDRQVATGAASLILQSPFFLIDNLSCAIKNTVVGQSAFEHVVNNLCKQLDKDSSNQNVRL